jgi:hypothetical protein
MPDIHKKYIFLKPFIQYETACHQAAIYILLSMYGKNPRQINGSLLEGQNMTSSTAEGGPPLEITIATSLATVHKNVRMKCKLHVGARQRTGSAPVAQSGNIPNSQRNNHTSLWHK